MILEKKFSFILKQIIITVETSIIVTFMLCQKLIHAYGESCYEDCKPERGSGGSPGCYNYEDYSDFSDEEIKARAANLARVIQLVSGRFRFMNLCCLTPYFRA